MDKATVRTLAGQQKLGDDREEALRFLRENLKARMRLGMLQFVEELFDEERRALIGEPWSRKGDGQSRSGGTERGSLYVEGQRIPMKYPRIKDGQTSRGIPAYQALRDYDLMAEDVQATLMRGVSTRDYGDVVRRIAKGTGLPHSAVSRAFVRASQKSLDDINGRDLSKTLFVGMFIDGLSFGGEMVVAAMGVTVEGEKMLLGLVEGHTENTAVVSQLLQNLVDRGLALTDRFLSTLDGSKALRAAVVQRWGARVEIQRCQVHKKRNVTDHLSRSHGAEVKRRMNVAYGLKVYEEAKTSLLSTVRWLEQISEPAARSLEEGLEETLTVVRLGLSDLLRRTFATTNPLESAFDGVRARTRRVKHWRKGKAKMALRWTAAAALEVEKCFHKIKGHAQLKALAIKLKEIKLDDQKKAG